MPVWATAKLIFVPSLSLAGCNRIPYISKRRAISSSWKSDSAGVCPLGGRIIDFTQDKAKVVRIIRDFHGRCSFLLELAYMFTVKQDSSSLFHRFYDFTQNTVASVWTTSIHTCFVAFCWASNCYDWSLPLSVASQGTGSRAIIYYFLYFRHTVSSLDIFL